jgi:hypothetical protein
VWGDSPKLKFRFSMLSGVVTIAAAVAVLPVSGVFSSVSTEVSGCPCGTGCP